MNTEQIMDLADAYADQLSRSGKGQLVEEARAALEAALQGEQKEFIKHEGDDDGWSKWVCPDPKSYLMKCCDCGLVHEAQFNVVRYKSATEREDCDVVDDPNLQAVFRMRRSEQWTPEDTAYRPGGLSISVPEAALSAKQGEQEAENKKDSQKASLAQAVALLEEAITYTSSELWSPSMAQEIELFVIEVRKSKHTVTEAKQERISELEAQNAQLLVACKAALSDDQPYIEKCRAAIAAVEGKV